MSNLRELLEITYEYPVEGVSHFFFFLFVSLLTFLLFLQLIYASNVSFYFSFSSTL